MKKRIEAALMEHKVVGAGGFGVEEILCSCRYGYRAKWMTPSEYVKHLAGIAAKAAKS